MRTSKDIMTEMRQLPIAKNYVRYVELEREYMAAQDRERAEVKAEMIKLDGKRGWFRSLINA